MRQQDKTVDLILRRIEDVGKQYHRLVLLVGIAGSGKTSALHTISSRVGAPICSAGAKLSERMLELSTKGRATKLSLLLGETVNAPSSDIVILDNLEVLFDPSLRANPLELLKSLSKKRTVVASWPGHVDNNHLIYAKPGHPEHRRFAKGGLVIVEMDKQCG